MKRLLKLRIALFVALALLLPVFSGCGKKGGGAGGNGGGMMVPIIEASAKSQPVVERLALVGTIMANEIIDVTAEADGIVADIAFAEGEKVEKGKLLIRLDETKFAAALSEAESNFKLSRATFERSKQLFNDRLISQQEFDEASARFQVNQALVERRARELKDARILAPFTGVTGARLVSPGQVIARGARLTTLVDMDVVKVEVNVPERFLGQVKLGQELSLRVSAYPGRTFTGKVFFIAPQLDAGTRTALVKAEVPNAEGALHPGMFANLDLTLQVRQNAIVIPEAAITLNQNEATVWVIASDNTANPRPVQVGLRMPGTVEIIDGLKAGDRVVVEGIQKLIPGVKVVSGAAQPTPAPAADAKTNQPPAARQG
jgi:membrane fusion protein (multidrug efflux system)